MAGEKMLMGLDIGSSKIRCVIGSVNHDGQLMVDSVCERPSEGVRSGSIVNIELTLKAISSAINEAELQAGTEISEAIVGIGGENIVCMPSTGVAGIKGNGQEIKEEDVLRSLDIARSFELPPDREIIHTLVQEFNIDGQGGIKDPIDMLGHRLETKALIVTASASIAQNKRKCVMRSGLNVRRVVLQSLADSEVVLSPEEKEMGVILINIGSGTTNMIVYSHGAPQYAAGINEGGDLVTSDLAQILNKPRQMAQRIKFDSGYSYVPSVPADQMVTIPSVQGMPAIVMPKRELARIIEARMAEIFSRLQQGLVRSGVSGSYGGGVILVGGGALLSGVTELAHEIFGIPARLGFPEAISGLDRNYINPSYTTVLGLLKYEAKKVGESALPRRRREAARSGGQRLVVSRIKGFFRTLF